jgi:arginine:pyruvate transaminase
MRFASRVERLSGPGAEAWNIHIAAARRRDAGEDVIVLTVGDPDQLPPPAVVAATTEALRQNRTGYAPILGDPRLREAIASRHRRRHGEPCATENVAVAPGAQGGLYCVMQCLAGPGDEIVVPEPAYATYEAVVGASGARMVTVPLDPERGFHPDLDAVAAAVTPHTRTIWINTPHNPTGAVLTREEIAAIGELCVRRDLWLVCDEVYEDLAFARPHVSPWSLPGLAERTVVVSSLSKSHALPGFRLGWIIGPPDLIRHLFDLLLCMTYGSPPFIQDGAFAALMAELPEVAALRENYRRRAALVSGMLQAAPNCRVREPEGGMFVLFDIRGTGFGSDEFARLLLDRAGVAVLPCDGFGPSAVGYLRISLTAADARLEEAASRILRFAGALAAAKP